MEKEQTNRANIEINQRLNEFPQLQNIQPRNTNEANIQLNQQFHQKKRQTKQPLFYQAGNQTPTVEVTPDEKP